MPSSPAPGKQACCCDKKLSHVPAPVIIVIILGHGQPGPRQASLLLGQGIVPHPCFHRRHLGSWDAQQPKSCLNLTGAVEITRRPWEGGVHSLTEGADLLQTMPGGHGEKKRARSSSASTTHRPTTHRAFNVERKDQREQDQAARPGKETGSILETHGQGDGFCYNGPRAQPVRASTAQTDLRPLRDGCSCSQAAFILWITGYVL